MTAQSFYEAANKYTFYSLYYSFHHTLPQEALHSPCNPNLKSLPPNHLTF